MMGVFYIFSFFFLFNFSFMYFISTHPNKYPNKLQTLPQILKQSLNKHSTHNLKSMSYYHYTTTILSSYFSHTHHHSSHFSHTVPYILFTFFLQFCLYILVYSNITMYTSYSYCTNSIFQTHN